jgi:hypothetical protein
LSQGATSTGGEGGGKVFLQTLECLIRFRGPLEPASHLEELEEWKAPFSELRDKPPESCHAPHEALSFLQTGSRLHAFNCFHLRKIHFDAATRHEEAQELPYWYPEHAFLRDEFEPGGL